MAEVKVKVSELRGPINTQVTDGCDILVKNNVLC